MKNLEIRKRAISIAVAAVIGVASYRLVDGITSFSQPPKADLAYSTYHVGNIYIGSPSFLDNLDVTKEDILIEDHRHEPNPFVRIRDSYKIKSRAQRFQIIDGIIAYEYDNPSDWNRENDRKALEAEWKVHNMFYELDLARNHTRDVDLDNGDKYIYEKTLIRYIA